MSHTHDAAKDEAKNEAAKPGNNFLRTIIERDLADIEMALSRLDAGTYWVDEITGQRLPDAVLEANPLARRNPA